MYLDIFLAFILDVWPSVNLLAYVIGIRIFCIRYFLYHRVPTFLNYSILGPLCPM